MQFHVCRTVFFFSFSILADIFLQEKTAERMTTNFVGAKILGFIAFF